MQSFGFISFGQFAFNNNTKPAWFAAVLPDVAVCATRHLPAKSARKRKIHCPILGPRFLLTTDA